MIKNHKLSNKMKLVLLLAPIILLTVIGIGVYTLKTQNSVQQKPISAILQMADAHQLKSIKISGDTIEATSTSGILFKSTKENQQVITDLLRNDGVSVNVEAASDGSWYQLWINSAIVMAIIAFIIVMAKRSQAGGGQALSFGRSRAQKYNESFPTILFSDVAGVDEAKTELEEIVHFLRFPEKFAAMGARVPKGVLLVGPPGTGKTLISRAVAGEAGVAFYSISGSAFVEMYVGVGASRVRDLFNEAKAHAPAIVFIDEIDAVGRQRSSMMAGGNDEREQTLNQLLVEMDGFDKNANVIVLAATNRPDMLDQALLRPGRFDRQVMLERPDIKGRKAILTVHAEGKPLAETIDLDRLASQTMGFSGADLANLMNEAAILAARNDRPEITLDDLEESILRVMAGPEKKSRAITEQEKAIIAYHEVGHAIVMRSTPGADPVRKVTAIARGMALGITVQSPDEDRYLMRKSELIARMVGAMGGRAAEEIIFGDITSGAAQDIQYATKIARKMVCELGMSPLGNVLMFGEENTISPQTAGRIDKEIEELVNNSYRKAKDILQERKEKLTEISEHLIQVETIDGAELDAMLFGDSIKQMKPEQKAAG